MKCGKEISWWRSLAIALCCQVLLIYPWAKHYFGGWRIEVPLQIAMMYFVVPLVTATIWQSWKVFFAAVTIPITLVVGETLYYLIRLKLG